MEEYYFQELVDKFNMYREDWSDKFAPVLLSVNVTTTRAGDGKVELLREWNVEDWKTANESSLNEYYNSLAVKCGPSTKWLVLDVGPEAMPVWKKIMKKLEKVMNGGVFDTFTVKAPGGRLHYHFHLGDCDLDERLNGVVRKPFVTPDGKSLDIRVHYTGSFVFMPPSNYTTPDGKTKAYQFTNMARITEPSTEVMNFEDDQEALEELFNNVLVTYLPEDDTEDETRAYQPCKWFVKMLTAERGFDPAVIFYDNLLPVPSAPSDDEVAAEGEAGEVHRGPAEKAAKPPPKRARDGGFGTRRSAREASLAGASDEAMEDAAALHGEAEEEEVSDDDDVDADWCEESDSEQPAAKQVRGAPRGKAKHAKKVVTTGKYTVVRAPDGWPTGDPASVLGKSFLFHINLGSWHDYAKVYKDDYLQSELTAEGEDPAVHTRGATWSTPRTFGRVVAACKTASVVGGVPEVFFSEPLRKLAPYVSGGGEDASDGGAAASAPMDVDKAWTEAAGIPWSAAVRTMTEVQLAHELYRYEQAKLSLTVADKVLFCFSKAGVELTTSELAMLNVLLRNAETTTPLEIGKFAAVVAAKSFRYGTTLKGTAQLYEVHGGLYSKHNGTIKVMAQTVQERLMNALRLVKRMFRSDDDADQSNAPPDTFSPPGAPLPCSVPDIVQVRERQGLRP